MRITRATIAGIVVGVLLLAVLAGYAIGLPKVEGALPSLPDRLDAKFVAISAASPTELGSTGAQDDALLQQVTGKAKDGDKKAADHLSDLYGDAVVRSYIDVSQLSTGQPLQSAPPQLSVAVVKGEAGLVMFSGPLQNDQDGQHYHLEKVDGYQCADIYTDPQPATQTTPASGTRHLETECRGSANGLAYDVFASGLYAKTTAGYLHRVIAGDFPS